MPYKRFCRDCDVSFQPLGKHQRLCKGCWRLAKLKNIKKMKTHSENRIRLKNKEKNGIDLRYKRYNLGYKKYER